jgi:[ribosomal protein S18]-alanine N-acetyltransferase
MSFTQVFASALAPTLAPPAHLGEYSPQMRMARLAKSSRPAHIRRSKPADLDGLFDLEHRVFAADRMSRRSLRRLLGSPSAVILVAEAGGTLAGVVVVLFRANSRFARRSSIAVAPTHAGRGIAAALIAAAEKAARSRQCDCLRLEVHEKNRNAIKLYRKAGFHQFGRHHCYYEDRGHALRFAKPLVRP